MINWIIENYIEIVGALIGFAYIYFEIKQKIWLWPCGIVMALFYIYIFFESKFYADMSIQFYYIGVSIWGWHLWLKKSERDNTHEISTLSRRLGLRLLSVTTLIYCVISYLLIYYTDSPMPYWDSLTTSLSITATWMLARKIIEQWLVWIVVNFISVVLYVIKDLHATSILYFVFGVLAIVGYYQWKNTLAHQIHSKSR